MADVLIRNIDTDTLKRLKEIAKMNNRSLQEELHELLLAHTGKKIDEARQMVRDIQKAYEVEGKILPDSTDDVRQERQR